MDGKVFQGATGASNHIGHIVIYPDGPKTPYGNRGVLEQYVSTKGIVRLAKEAGLKPPPGEKWEAHTFQKMAVKGNKKARKVFEKAGEILGIGLTSTIHLINPNVVIFSGGVSGAKDLFWGTMLREIHARCFKAHLKGLKFKMAKLGDDMGAVGAARVAWQLLEN